MPPQPPQVFRRRRASRRAVLVSCALTFALVAWLPLSSSPAAAIYCYSGDPAPVYQACLAYNQGIQQQVSNQQQLQSIQSQINNAVAQINSLESFMLTLKRQITAQQALEAQTTLAINGLSRQIRFGTASVTRLEADEAVRDQLLGQRIRYDDDHGSVNYVELILTSANFNQLVNRLIATEQIAASDRTLLNSLSQEHAQVAAGNATLDDQRSQMNALLSQQQATEASLKANLVVQSQSVVLEQKLEAQLSAQYQQVEAERVAIDAKVAQLAQEYAAEAEKAGGGSGVFEWPEPACNFSCITQGFGCSSFYLEVPDPSCPYPHKIHTGIDIAGPNGTPIVAADTGVVYLYPNSVGYGNLVVMIHGNGYETYYGHTERYAPGLQTGMIVPRGETIAFEGETGWATGPHVHFEIRVNGIYKDPCIWLGC